MAYLLQSFVCRSRKASNSSQAQNEEAGYLVVSDEAFSEWAILR